MSKTETTPWIPADYLKTEEDCAMYLQAVIDDFGSESALLVAALSDIARARGTMQLAWDTDHTREGF